MSAIQVAGGINLPSEVVDRAAIQANLNAASALAQAGKLSSLYVSATMIWLQANTIAPDSPTPFADSVAKALENVEVFEAAIKAKAESK